MKKDFIACCEILSSAVTPHFCGSACLLSLCSVVEEIKETSIGFDKAFPDISSVSMKLFDDDSKLFDLSKKTESLSLSEWDEVESVLADYTDLLLSLVDLEDFCAGTYKQRYLPFVRHDHQFLIGIASSSAEAFCSRNDQPESFSRCYHDLLSATEKGNHLSLDEAGMLDKRLKEETLLRIALPALAMLIKLLNRKNSGKKPFSAEFDFSSVMAKVNHIQQDFQAQLNEKKVREGMAESLEYLSDIALKAREEIKLASLKEDYSWISLTFQDCKKSIMI